MHVNCALRVLVWLALISVMGCGRTQLADATASADAAVGHLEDATGFGDSALNDDPSDDDIRRTNLFSEPLVLVGGTSTREANRALANAIHTDLTRGDRFNTDALEAFLRDHPRSPWRASLQLNLGILHRQIGRYRSALDAWEEAWALTRDGSGEEVRALADRAVSELALLHAQLGRRGRLDELQAELRLRPPLGPAAERYARAQIGRATMEAHPERAYRCGPFALTSVWTMLHPGVTPPNALLEATSSMNGTSLSQLAALAARAGEPMRALRRAPGTPWTAPSVVHWRVDHFAALVAIEVEPSGRKVFVLRDPTFGGEVRTTERWLEEEASGHVLVPQGERMRTLQFPRGWQYPFPHAELPMHRAEALAEEALPSGPLRDAARAAPRGLEDHAPVADDRGGRPRRDALRCRRLG